MSVLSRKQLNLLQVFRGLAAILVLLYHGTTMTAINLQQVLFGNSFVFAHVGVNFFFVLSGFIIFYIHKIDIGKKHKFKDFLIKRFIRVYPVYWLVLIPRLLVSRKEIDIFTALSSIVLFPYPDPPLVNVSWTLSYEIFFYLIFSLTMIAGFRYFKVVVVIWLGLLGIYWLLYTANIFAFSQENLIFKFIFSYHHLEFALGCLAAYLVKEYKIKSGKIILATGIILFTLSSIATVNYINAIADSTLASPVMRTQGIKTSLEELGFIYYGIPSFLIILGAVSIELVQEIKVPQIWVYLGDASYSIYLIHGTIINNLTLLIKKLQIETFFQNDISKSLILFVALIAGCLFHSYIEKPLINQVKKQVLIYKNNWFFRIFYGESKK
jgi:exopolysaccharide production protein ExoZ